MFRAEKDISEGTQNILKRNKCCTWMWTRQSDWNLPIFNCDLLPNLLREDGMNADTVNRVTNKANITAFIILGKFIEQTNIIICQATTSKRV